ncbi:MAG: VWA domain-containing protein [Chitinophagales bacterium]
MFIDFFYLLRNDGIKVTLHEYLALLEAVKKGLANYNLDDFYALSKTILIKHENQLDRFDQLFGQYFQGMEAIPNDFFEQIPEDWLRKNLVNQLSEEEKAMIEAMGGMDKLMERFKELMKEQNERHEGGNKWIGTGGTSPFGAYGYNPEGFRVGQEGSRNRRAVKVWDKRNFADLDDSVELDTRNMKMVLKRLRELTREGAEEELDMDGTIRKTSENAGMLDIKMQATKKNRVKVLMLMDVGGSMDDHVELCSRLFSAARHQFKHLEFYYFHNCLYESVWKDNKLRFEERIPTWDILNKYNKDYKVIFVGDAAMSPYEVVAEGGSVEHYNPESGMVWLERMKEHFPNFIWINPNPEYSWEYFQSTQILQEIMENRMFPMTLSGLQKAMKALKDTKIKHQQNTEFLGAKTGRS